MNFVITVDVMILFYDDELVARLVVSDKPNRNSCSAIQTFNCNNLRSSP